MRARGGSPRWDAWDRDAVELVASGHFTFEVSDSSGSFGFVVVESGMDCVYSAPDGRPRVEFSGLGEDDRRTKNGRGWAELVGPDELRGHIFIHQGMDSAFKATRDALIPRAFPAKRGSSAVRRGRGSTRR